MLLDKDRTPTGVGKQSAISRLENKYSDVLERAAGRRRHEEDRDKTLEPDDYGAGSSSHTAGLLRSATSHQLAKSKLSSSSFNAADRKERTPYRTRAQRQRYNAESNDSGYLTSNNRLLDENYPLDYGQRYDYHDALRLGGASGYPSNRYGRRAEEEVQSPRSTRAYGRTKTMESMLAAELPDAGRSAEDRPLNSRNRFAHRRKEQPPPELTAEEREILADDRSSEDNAAILLLLREDNQFLEAKKFEERMRKRRELRDRVKRMEEAAEEAKKTEAAVAAAEAEAAALEQEAKKAKETAAAAAAASAAAAAAAASASSSAAGLEPPQEAPKKKSRSKKVTRDDSDGSGSGSTSESSSSDEAETETETDSAAAAPGVQLTHTADTPQTPTQTQIPSVNGSSTSHANTTTTTSSSTSSSALSNHTLAAPAAASTALSSGTTNQSRFLPHSDRNNNDLAKYKPSNQLMHSSSSGALAFGGIGARLAAADAKRQLQHQQRYQGASSRTAAVLSEFDRYKPGSGTGTGSGYGSSYLHDSYSGSSRRSNALGGGSSLYPQRSHLDAYQQQSSYLQQHDHYQLAKSATSSALFNRSRIPKTLSTFVSRRRATQPQSLGIGFVSSFVAPLLLTATAQRPHCPFPFL